jgi:S-sulfo-L-cysteine synthase (O-acetyl-L-serine-dependent)
VTVSIALAEPLLWKAVGNTPLLSLPPEGSSELWLKAEWLNPGGSVKDRAARSILREGLRLGDLPGKRLLDASSGNTAIAYAMLGAAAGIKVTICLPGNASPERQALLELYGAEIVTTDRLRGSEGAVEVARSLVDAAPERFWYADQYGNPANPGAHRETTGPELWSQTRGRITHFVAAMGTTGTIMGTGKYLKSRNPSVRVIGVQPDSPLHGLEGLKHFGTTTHIPSIYDPGFPDEIIAVATESADATARDLARTQGLLVGWSAGAALWAAREVARREPGAIVVVIGCDTGTRYLSERHRWRSP